MLDVLDVALQLIELGGLPVLAGSLGAPDSQVRRNAPLRRMKAG